MRSKEEIMSKPIWQVTLDQALKEAESGDTNKALALSVNALARLIGKLASEDDATIAQSKEKRSRPKPDIKVLSDAIPLTMSGPGEACVELIIDHAKKVTTEGEGTRWEGGKLYFPVTEPGPYTIWVKAKNDRGTTKDVVHIAVTIESPATESAEASPEATAAAEETTTLPPAIDESAEEAAPTAESAPPEAAAAEEAAGDATVSAPAAEETAAATQTAESTGVTGDGEQADLPADHERV